MLCCLQCHRFQLDEDPELCALIVGSSDDMGDPRSTAFPKLPSPTSTVDPLVVSPVPPRLRMPASRESSCTKTANLKHNSVPPDFYREISEKDSLTRKERRYSLLESGYGKMASYTRKDKLGQGTYATVYRGRSLVTDLEVAMKEIRLEPEEGAPCTAIREVSLLRTLRHANIVTLHDVIYTSKTLTLIFEYANQDLKKYIEACPSGIMNLSNVRLFIYQLLRGLEFCHRQFILHRDLKPQNLLITERGDLKLADFGLARAKSIPINTYSNEVVTLWYRPPDVLLGSTKYSTNIDMWGVGCILFELIAGKPCFPGGTVKEELGLIFRTLGHPTEANFPGITENVHYKSLELPPCPTRDISRRSSRLSPTARDLILECFHYNIHRRISAQKAMEHPYLAEGLPLSKLKSLHPLESIFELSDVELCKEDNINSSHDINGIVHTDTLQPTYSQSPS